MSGIQLPVVAVGVDGSAESMIAARWAAASELRDRFPELEMRAAAVHDDPRRAVVDVAEHAALTVVGSRGRGRIPELLLGSVALYVAAHARSPVAVVPPTTDVSAESALGPILLGVDGSAD